MDFDYREIGQTVLLAVTVLAAGFFAGLTVATQLALNATAPLTLPAWAVTVDQMRMASAGVIVLGFIWLLALERRGEVA
jgi:hypothetical protein